MNSSAGQLPADTAAPAPENAETTEVTETTETTVLRFVTAMLRPALWSTVAVGLLTVLVASLLSGFPGAVGAAFGALLVIACCWFNIVAMRWTAKAQPVTVMAVAIGCYCGKFVALLTLLLVLADTTLFDIRAFALAILVAAVVWTAGELVGFLRARVATITPVPSNDASSAGAGSGQPAGNLRLQ
ncbi:hypothetical protein [Haloactinomyces albus]|uniref:ATP synthase protein I n=1 Tax=Haloactinomyces albus TaxID=1352928 RepID=A0AAE3ZC58_9ACTN|nr:hypothetical protein [Haloactinomyces albus]MDR7301145.1 ATP synthase protein I [Haloactinomyces albus]